MTKNFHHTKAEIICDSIGDTVHFPRLTTFVLTYPRYIHSEFMTHRQFSRNASSSRAIPTAKLLEKVRKDPVTPIRWGMNQSGMQAKMENLPEDVMDYAMYEWQSAADKCALVSEKLAEAGLHKQWCNRLTEPFSTITVVCTATDYANFFALRCAPDAQPEIYDLAWKMADLYYQSTPRSAVNHLPFIKGNDLGSMDELFRMSAARCARVSYLNHDQSKPDKEKDLALANMLLTSRHMSPFEHQATADTPDRSLTSNFRGWTQYRKTLIKECVHNFDYNVERERQGRI